MKPEILTFQVNFDLDGRGQYKTTGILTKVFYTCTSDANLVVLAWLLDELLCGQAQSGVNLEFKVKFDLEGRQGNRWIPRTKGQ